MFRLRSFRAWFGCIVLTTGWQALAAELTLPPITGELEGKFAPLRFPGVPPVGWKLTLRGGTSEMREVDFAIDGPGVSLHGDARLDTTGEGTWRLREGRVDLANWLGALAPIAGGEFAAVNGSGALTIAGEGTWRGGELGGRARIGVRDGRMDDPTHKLLLEGVAVEIEVVDLAALRTAPLQRLTWTSGRYDVVPLGKGRIEFALEGEKLSVKEAAIEIFGGELSLGALEMSTKSLEFSTMAKMNGVEIGQILFLLPPVLSEARGKLDGQMALSRDATGIQIGKGRLALREGETADLRLAVKPGWLSTSLPPEIVKYFPGFQKIETGEIPIRARVLEMTFTPLGDASGRTAWVHLEGGPSDPDLTAPIDTTVNVRGPLEEVVKIGTDLGTSSRLRFGSAK
ncbi:MAG: YdbH domain-containing protein [Opitutaceae bacterium]